MTVALTASPAWAQGTGEQGAEAADRPAASGYQALVARGIREAAAGDRETAAATLTQATRSNPGEAPAFLYLASVERMRGNLTNAFEHFRTCASLAGRSGASSAAPRQPGGDHVSRSRCLQGVAEVLELRDGALGEAKQAWQALAEFLEQTPGAGNAQMARARMTVITRVMEQQQAYVAVRERIAAREASNAADSSGRSNR